MLQRETAVRGVELKVGLSTNDSALTRCFIADEIDVRNFQLPTTVLHRKTAMWMGFELAAVEY